jgi:hypothetical protein
MLVGGNIMNLIDKFENMPFQDVGTFNSIFVTTPLMGFDFKEPVLIGALTNGNERKILVGNTEVLIDLTQRKSLKPEKRTTFVKPKGTTERCNKSSLKLPAIYKILKPTEFMIYSAIKEVGEVDGIEELSRRISISNKSIIANLPRLIELGLIKKKYVTVIGKAGSFNKLTIDTTCNLH